MLFALLCNYFTLRWLSEENVRGIPYRIVGTMIDNTARRTGRLHYDSEEKYLLSLYETIIFLSACNLLPEYRVLVLEIMR